MSESDDDYPIPASQIHPYLLMLHKIERSCRDVFANNPFPFKLDPQRATHQNEMYEVYMTGEYDRSLEDTYELLAVTNSAIIAAMDKVRSCVKLMGAPQWEFVEWLLQTKDDTLNLDHVRVNPRIDYHLRDGEANFSDRPDTEDDEDRKDERAEQERMYEVQAKYPKVDMRVPPTRSEWVELLHRAEYGMREVDRRKPKEEDQEILIKREEDSEEETE